MLNIIKGMRLINTIDKNEYVVEKIDKPNVLLSYNGKREFFTIAYVQSMFVINNKYELTQNEIAIILEHRKTERDKSLDRKLKEIDQALTSVILAFESVQKAVDEKSVIDWELYNNLEDIIANM